MTDLHTALRDVGAILKEYETHPYGPSAAGQARIDAGGACVRLCGGDQDKGRTLWTLIRDELGYMPVAAAVALKWASRTDNLVPDIPAPDLDAPRGPAADGNVIS
jgi:hypothetical protein